MTDRQWRTIIWVLIALFVIYVIWILYRKYYYTENFDVPKITSSETSTLFTTEATIESTETAEIEETAESASFSILNKLANTNYEKISQIIRNFMTTNKIPSGQLCVIQNNEIVYQKPFGNINCEGILANRPNRSVTNNDVFRIASSSKAITGMGILILVDKGLINLDQSAFDILAKAGMIDKSTIKDNRVMNITVRQLLRHEGGWDSSIGIPEKERTYEEEIYDPQYDALRIASRDKTRPATALEIIQYVITKSSLNFPPGSKYVYSNFGYNVLGRIIEAVTKKTYEKFTQDALFSKVGITNAYIGNELMKNRGPNEVMCCDQNDNYSYPVNISAPFKAPQSYGSFVIRVMDSHGGWVISATDLAKFGNGFLTKKYMSDNLHKQMYIVPSYANKSAFYSLGFRVMEKAGETFFYHNGALTYGTLSGVIISPKTKTVIGFTFNHLVDDFRNKVEELNAAIMNWMIGF